MDAHDLVMEQQRREDDLRHDQDERERQEREERARLEEDGRNRSREDAERIDDLTEEEREKLRLTEQAAARDEADSKRRGWHLFGRAREKPAGLDDPDTGDDAEGAAPNESKAAASGGMGGTAAFALLAVAGVVGFFVWQGMSARKPAASVADVAQAPATAALPLAAPETEAAQGAGHERTLDAQPQADAARPHPAEPAAVAAQPESATAAVAALPEADESLHPSVAEAPVTAQALPAAEPARADETPDQPLPAAAGQESPAVQVALAVPAAAAPAPATVATPEDLAALRIEIAALQGELQTLRAEREAPQAATLQKAAATPPPAAKPRRVRAAPHPQAEGEAPKPSIRLVAPAAPKALPELLAIDEWAGKPSVIVGLAGDNGTQTRVLSPGDTLNGVQLKAVDAARGQAHFIAGGVPVTLTLNGGAQ